MTWFTDLMGFAEESPNQVRSQSTVKHDKLTSLANGKEYQIGEFQLFSLREIRAQSDSLLQKLDQPVSVTELIGNIQAFHQQAVNRGALFQVASQFNLLEMVSPSVTPEQGVGIYQYDGTQGPACAIACGAGTVYRNYFVPIDNQLGQSTDRQIDCLSLLGETLGNQNNELWQMRNGYALPSQTGLTKISHQLNNASPENLDQLRGQLKVGIHFDTEVTLGEPNHTVSQVYCSATPVAYSDLSADSWEPFAKLVLQAAYEATMRLAVINYQRTGNSRVFLTLLGGGAFGNQTNWIIEAIDRAINLVANSGLDIRLVSYASSNPDVRPLINRWSTL